MGVTTEGTVQSPYLRTSAAGAGHRYEYAVQLQDGTILDAVFNDELDAEFEAYAIAVQGLTVEKFRDPKVVQRTVLEFRSTWELFQHEDFDVNLVAALGEAMEEVA